MLVGPPLDARADLVRMVGTRAEVTPDDWAVAWAGGRMTWAELDAAANRWAGALHALGLREGDRVASLVPNRAHLLVHYLACVRSGLVAVPLNYRHVPRQIDHALDATGARLIVAHSERRDDLQTSDRVAALPLGCVWYSRSADAGQPDVDGLLTDEHPAPPRASDPSAPAFIFFTSGSTGPAKGVTHSADTMGWMVASAAAALEMTDRDIFLPASSMSHLGAFLWSMASLSAGGRVVVARTFDAGELLPLIRAHRPTLLAMIPAALTALVRDHGATREDFASIRLCRAGADHVPSELDVEFQQLTGFPIDEGYGMSEVGLATLSPPAGPIREGSIGTVNPGFAISIRDGDEEAPVGTVGRIWMKTPSATTGYWNNPDATAEAFRDGWINSGDLARRDDDGYLWFFGRAKQIIVHDGSNISPAEVEDALSEHPAVATVGVVGIHDTVHGENVRAYVTIVDGAARPSANELILFARTRVGYRAPEEIVVVDEIPLNPTGKVDRIGLKRIAEDHRNPARPG